MKKLIMTFCTVALISIGTLPMNAQSAQSTETKQNTTSTSSNGTAKSSLDRVNGKVESYDAGKSLKVSVPGKIITSKSFSLDSKDYTYHVPKNLKPGDWISVTDKTDTNGHKTLTVRHSKGSSAPQS